MTQLTIHTDENATEKTRVDTIESKSCSAIRVNYVTLARSTEGNSRLPLKLFVSGCSYSGCPAQKSNPCFVRFQENAAKLLVALLKKTIPKAKNR